jgi:3'(2'), 5'-bisphosphate nucleotidase / inositol polyphosphate 1-phosphatase
VSWEVWTKTSCETVSYLFLLEITRQKHKKIHTGAQALVTWSLRRAFPDQPFSMVAEEDAADLRVPGPGAAMADRITALVNAVLAEEAENSLPGSDPPASTGPPAPPPPLSTADVLALIDAGASPGGPSGAHWVLDPIDGTRGFVGRRQYAVCLARLAAGRAVLGVLGCPNLPRSAALVEADGQAGGAGKDRGDVGVLFWAADGCGSYAEPLAVGESGGGSGDGSGGSGAVRLSVSNPAPGSPGVRFMESFEARHSDFSLAARLAAALGVTTPALRLDSQAKYGALARGDAAINLRFPPAGYREKIWDHAAGAVVAAEAGAVVSDAAGAPLDFSKGRWLDLHRGIVTAPPALHAALVEALKGME